jgi:hypothetical protein
MTRRNWRTVNPRSLREAIELCKDYALEKHRRNVDRIAELAGEESQWTVYGWLRDGSIPGKKIHAFQHACGCDFITRWLAHSSGMLLIPAPTGRIADVNDVHRLQCTLNAAVAALLSFASGQTDAGQVGTEITVALEALAWHRENTARSHQPELELDNHE